MGIIIGFLYRKKTKVIALAKTLDALTLIASMANALAERVAKEKGVDSEKAKEIVIECINSGMKTLN